MALRLPGAEDLSPAPSGRSGRPIASYDTTAIGRGVATLGAGLSDASQSVAAIDRQKQATTDQATRFETQRRFLEFQAKQREALDAAGRQAQPGAFGFKEGYQASYLQSAKEFFKSVPDPLKPEYDAKLFHAEDSLTTDALKFEREQRANYYTNSVSDGLTTIENTLYRNPGDFEANLQQGNELIENLPDGDVTPIQKEALRREWKQKAQLASLNGMPARERLRALGVVDSTPLPADVHDRAAMVRDHFVSLGYTPEQAAGIAGNLVQESHVLANGNAGDDGTAHGLAQWRDDRFVALKQFAAERGKEWTDFDTQLAFIDHELNGTHSAAGQALKSAATVEEATAAFIGYEKPRGYTPANPSGGHGWTNRLAAAQKIAGVEVTARDEPDPRFADLGYAVQDKAVAAARAEINHQVTEQKAVDTAQYNALKGSLTLGIQTGEVTSQTDILDSGLTDADKASLLKAYDTKQEQDGQARALNDAVLGGDGVTINSFDAKVTNVADKAYQMAVSAVPEDQRQNVSTAWIETTKYIPKPLQATLRMGAASTDPAVLGQSMALADVMQKAAPTSFDHFDGSKEVGDELATYRTLVNGRGMSSEEAAKKMIAMNDPANKVSRDVLKPQADKFIKGLAVSDVTDAFDPGFLSSEPGAGIMPAQQNVLLSEYRETAKERFFETGDEDVAKALALEDIKRTWGASEVSGSPQLMRLPPEKAYPPIDGDFAYLRDDALKTAKDYVKETFGDDRAVENVALVADGKTRADIAAGRMPRYRLFYSYKQDGQTLFDEVYTGHWGIPRDQLQSMMGTRSETRHSDFEVTRVREERAVTAEQAGQVAGEKAYQETVGPDWMKARARENAIERARIGAADIRRKPAGTSSDRAEKQTREDITAAEDKALAAGEEAYKSTIGPDWMKERAREAAIERARRDGQKGGLRSGLTVGD